jgi:hypothetical protein
MRLWAVIVDWWWGLVFLLACVGRSDHEDGMW